jgi:hypothetical protein
MKGIQKNLNPPFFVSMATAVKFVQPIPIFLAYLVPLVVDVVPNKLDQFETYCVCTVSYSYYSYYYSYYYYSSFFLSSAKSLSDTFLSDY